MWNDPIVAELHAIREAHARQFHYNVQAIFADLKQQEQHSGRTYVRLPVKRRVANRANPLRKPKLSAPTPV